MTSALVALLAAQFINGSPAVTTTTGPLKFYLDPTGSDANLCTASGVGACRTFNGVWQKLPKFLLHDVQVYVAAGSYTFDSRFDGFNFGSAATSGFFGITVAVDGPALENITPATGSATGSITSIANGAVGAPLPIITDSAGTWTTNDLRGYFLVMTSGARNGQVRVITSNTATTITTDSWPSAPSNGDTFAIQTPSATITGDHSFVGLSGNGGTIRLSRLTLTSSSSTNNTVDARGHTPAALSTLGLPVCRVLKTAGALSAVVSSRASAWSGGGLTGTTTPPFYAASVSGPAINLVDSFVTTNFRAYAYSSSSSTAAVTISNFGGGILNMPQAMLVAETAHASGAAIRMFNVGATSTGAIFVGIHAICPSGSSGTGIVWSGSGGAQNNMTATNCATGVSVGSSVTGSEPSRQSMLRLNTNLICTNTTTCMSVERGARATLLGTNTFTGVTNEYNIDGVNTTNAAINALTPKRTTGNGLSIVELE